MNDDQLRAPDFLETPWTAPPTDLKELTLALYQRLSDCIARIEEREREAQEEIEKHTRRMSRLIAQLAAERFEYERLMQRVAPELERAGLTDLIRIFDLHARSWDANLRRAQVEVRGLTSEIVTDKLIEQIEVESAIHDPAVGEAVVRETLSPLVLLEGRIIGLAKVITSVPVPPVAEPDCAAQSEDQEAL